MKLTRPSSAVLFFAWAIMVAVLAWHQFAFWRSPTLNNDILALLPSEKVSAMQLHAQDKIADAATRQVVIIIGHKDAAVTKLATEAIQPYFSRQTTVLKQQLADEQSIQRTLDFYQAHAAHLLTDEQRQWLRDAPSGELSQRALERLYSFDTAIGGIDWKQDPLGLHADWWQARLGNRFYQDQGLDWIEHEGKSWAILRYESQLPAFQLDGKTRIQNCIDTAKALALKTNADIELLSAGVPLHAEAAAARANWEISTIGYGSLAAVLLLVFLSFMRARPILLVASSLLVGCAAGVSVTVLLFGDIHLLTLVFGASLVGVAEDYGIHYFCSRQEHSQEPGAQIMRKLMPGLLLAFATSALAYLTLGLAPLPGLKQMAVFSATGLFAAFLTVVCWFPLLDGRAPKQTWLSRVIGATLKSWPRWNPKRAVHLLSLIALSVFIASGLWQIRADDSLRHLQSSSNELTQQESRVAQILDLPSPAQYLLVSGDSAESVLQQEERLKSSLQQLINNGAISSYRATSDWLPSIKRQAENYQLITARNKAVLDVAADELNEQFEPVHESASGFQAKQWMQLDSIKPMQIQWLGQVDDQWGSVVLLSGLDRYSVQKISNAVSGLQSVKLINRSAEISNFLSVYRHKMSLVLIAGYVLVALALFARFKRHAWRALLPTILAALISLAVLGWRDEPVQLFSILAQFLLLGVGVDYGIFLLEHQEDSSSWLAVCLGAASTILAFGLLALSSTPALHSFGLCMLVGISSAWLLAPCFRPLTDNNFD